MGLKLILRRNSTINLFRDLLIDTACSNIGNKILICSGFFQEHFKNSSYKATAEQNFISKFKNTKKEITTIGIHNNCWLPSYKNFVNEFRKHNIPIKALKRKKFKWYAKVYLLFEDDTPIFGIIGSSNITKNAFSDDPKSFNIEADVIIWKDDINLNRIIEGNFSNIQYDDYYNIDYSEQRNGGKTIQDRLNDLYKDILAESNDNDEEVK